MRHSTALLTVLCLVGFAAQADARSYIRDEIRVNMRAGPGLQYKIIELLTSGDPVRNLGTEQEWTRVRSAAGKEGWVPKGYVTNEPPPSVALPGVQAKLTQATSKIDELTKKLATQATAIQELDELRSSNQELLSEVNELTWSSGWKSMATGAAVIVLGMVIGLLIPRGSGARNRLKL